MPSILIADDHHIVRIGMSIMLKSIFPTCTVREADSFDSLIHMVRENSFHLVILDINIPGGNNHQMVGAIKLRLPEAKVLVFSAYDEAIYAQRYLQAGADGYLYKESTEPEIKRALQAIFRDERYVSSSFKQQMLDRVRNNQTYENPLTGLSTRETEVLQLLVKGDTVVSISQTLNLQLSTVSTYKTRLFEKLGVNNLVNLLETVRLYSA